MDRGRLGGRRTVPPAPAQVPAVVGEGLGCDSRDIRRAHLLVVRQPYLADVRASDGEHAHRSLERGTERGVGLVGDVVLRDHPDADPGQVRTGGLCSKRGVHAVRVARVMPGDDLQHDGAVGCAPDKGPNVVQL